MPSEEKTRQKNGRAAGYSYKEKVSVEPCGQKSYDQCRDPGPDVVCSRDYRGEGHDCESDIRHIVEERAEPAVRDLFSEHKKGEHPDAVHCKAHDQKRRINSRIHNNLLIQWDG